MGFFKKEIFKDAFRTLSNTYDQFFLAKIKLRPVLHNPKYASDIFFTNSVKQTYEIFKTATF